MTTTTYDVVVGVSGVVLIGYILCIVCATSERASTINVMGV